MSISMHIQNFVKICKTVQDIKRKRKNYDRGTDGWTSDDILSICSQGIELKRNFGVNKEQLLR